MILFLDIFSRSMKIKDNISGINAIKIWNSAFCGSYNYFVKNYAISKLTNYKID